MQEKLYLIGFGKFLVVYVWYLDLAHYSYPLPMLKYFFSILSSIDV